MGEYGIPKAFGQGGSGLSEGSGLKPSLRDYLIQLFASSVLSVADASALEAVDADSRSDDQVAITLDDGTFWTFDAASTTSPSGTVLRPDDVSGGNPGRWLATVSGLPADVNVIGAPVADIAALKAIAGASRADGEIVAVADTNALWQFNAASSETGDDLVVVQPTVGTGRWYRIDRANLGACYAVTTLTALKAVPARWRSNGQLAVVTADGSKWRFVAGSSLTNDDVLVAAPAAGTGRWIRADATFDFASAAITSATADAAVLYTVPVGFVLLVGVPYWKVDTTMTTASAAAAGLSSNNAGLSTKGDLLGGASGDVVATLVSTGAYAKGTVGAMVGKPGAVLVAGDTIRYDLITGTFTGGSMKAHVPLTIAVAP